MSILSTAFDFIGGSKLKLIAATIFVVALIACGIYVKMLQRDIVDLTQQNKTLEINNTVLTGSVETLKHNQQTMLDVNDENQKTIKKLIAERQQAQKAIDDLARARESDKKALNEFKTKLEELLKDPKNDGIVSPALRETIRNIQNSRG